MEPDVDVRWQVTAKTILCEESGQICTILVYKDGTAKCTFGERSHFRCPKVLEYKEALFEEEKRSTKRGGG